MPKLQAASRASGGNESDDYAIPYHRLSVPSAPEVYFDTNAFRDLFRDKQPAREAYLRLALRRAVRLRRIRVITSVVTIEELGAIARSDWLRYGRVTAFVFSVIRGGLLTSNIELLTRELRRGRRLRGPERFVSPSDQLELRLTCRSGQAAVLESSVLAGQRARESTAKHRLRIPEILSDLSADGRNALEEVRRSDATAAERIDRWTRDVLLKERIGDEAAERYPLRNVPTATNLSRSLSPACGGISRGGGSTKATTWIRTTTRPPATRMSS